MTQQVSHGLNLSLKLRSKDKMGELLFKIAQAQSKIDAGLDELGFVHFARFLPTHDSTALQVITEFDGPLAPYVLDFAIEIGDVFDMLLSYTEGAEHIIPIRDHPAEFLAFVQKNNTVSVTGLPPQQDLGLYSAYRDRTVLEIVGPREALPMPKEDRKATPVELHDVQGNVLKGYRAVRATHYLLKVENAGEARRWLAARTQAAAALPAVNTGDVWTAETKPKLMLNIGLTSAGLQALALHPGWLAPFPSAFMEGALKRAADNFDVDANDPKHWWLGGDAQAPDLHVMVSLYQGDAADDKIFDAADAALRVSLASGGLRLVDTQELGPPKEALGLRFADGISEPRVADKVGAPRDDCQPASTAGEFVLGASYDNIYGGSSLGALPGLLASNGTFCAVRVLALDVPGFHGKINSEAARLNVHPDWLAAKLMGRWPGGAPVSLHPHQSPTAVEEHSRNDFDYAPSHEFPDTPMDHAGLRCPVGAHIRRVNARTSRIAGSRYARRLMRRGMHYTRTVDGKEESGLFGLFICADLERQFEFIQRQWINGDRFAPGLRGTRDPFAGTPRSDGHRFQIPMPDDTALDVELKQFAYTRGSLYLFMPGLNALRSLDLMVDKAPPAAATPAAVTVAEPSGPPADAPHEPSTTH
jgi:deferrochelatase/peroxidase EfeB